MCLGGRVAFAERKLTTTSTRYGHFEALITGLSLSPSNSVARKIEAQLQGLRRRTLGTGGAGFKLWKAQTLRHYELHQADPELCALSARALRNNRCPISSRQQWALDLRAAHKETCHSLSQPRPHDPTDAHGHTGTSLCPHLHIHR